MDFSTWSLSDTILLVAVVISFIGQIAVVLHRTDQLKRHIDTQDDNLDRLEGRINNSIDQFHKRLNEVRTEVAGLHAAISQRFHQKDKTDRPINPE